MTCPAVRPSRSSRPTLERADRGRDLGVLRGGGRHVGVPLEEDSRPFLVRGHLLLGTQSPVDETVESIVRCDEGSIHRE